MEIPGGRSWAERAFRALDTDSRGSLHAEELLNQIKASGTYTNKQLAQLVGQLEAKEAGITIAEFKELISGRNFVKKVLEQNLMIPKFFIRTSSDVMRRLKQIPSIPWARRLLISHRYTKRTKNGGGVPFAQLMDSTHKLEISIRCSPCNLSAR